MDKMIEVVFADADAAHVGHLTTKSYAQHMALGEFYSGVREALDAIVESAIGLDLPPPEPPKTDIIDQIEAGYVELVEMKDRVCQGASTLENLFDGLLEQYTKALYKLKRLS